MWALRKTNVQQFAENSQGTGTGDSKQRTLTQSQQRISSSQAKPSAKAWMHQAQRGWSCSPLSCRTAP